MIYMAKIMIRLGNLVSRGFTSENLTNLLSGKIVPLAGISGIPYAKGGETLKNFKDQLYRRDIYYLVSKEEVIKALASAQGSEGAIMEINQLYQGWTYIPFFKSSCKIIEGLPENVVLQ
ncbi:MAG: hypothetical protein NT093_03345 [Candidatus Moranbacteria bacterium]|nr:hypothetical protein [Candidatus Moranbacteria bacterium]